MRLILLWGFTVIQFLSTHSYAQCSDWTTYGTDQGSLVFDGVSSTFQTTGTVTEQDYWTFNVTCGNVYSFDFCNNGGASGSLYPDITLLNGTSVLASSLNGNSCGNLTWTANYTGTAILYITDNWDGCASSPNYTANAMAYNEQGPIISYSNIQCSSADATLDGISGGTFSFNPVPGDGAIINSSNGNITNGTPGTTYTVDYTEGTCGSTAITAVTLPLLDASFTTSTTGCTTVSSTITGDSGGTFSFNPAPGDGATIDATTGEVTSGIPGNSYTIEYALACNTSSTESVTLPASGNASFSLNPSCGGAVPVVYGDLGGAFSFNPAPGDGSQINATSGIVSNATAGTTYYVEYSVCGGSSTESVTVLDDNCFTLVASSDAQLITVNGEQCIQLTAAANDETGCAWNGNQINFNNDFSLNLDYYFGSNANGADGTTFTFHSASPSSCGEPGAMLGAGGSGVSDALIIEFDTYDNDGGTNNDLSADHIAVEIDEILIDDPTSGYTNQAPLCGPEEAIAGGADITDGLMHNVEINWDATNQLLNIYFDGDLRLTCNNDFVTNAFGGNNIVYWGATAATGGLNNQQYFCPSTVVILPVELTEFYSNCEEDQEVFHWISESEKDLDFYELEYTYDGLVFYTEEKVNAVGTTDTKTNYSVNVSKDDELKRYYRLKLTDIDGRTETTDLITSKNCNSVIQNLIGSISQTGSTVDVSLTTSGSILVIDQMGKILMESEKPGSHFTIKIDHLDAGVYSIIAIDADQTMKETKRFVKGF